MKKIIYQIVPLLTCCLFILPAINAQQQESLRDRLAKKQQQGQSSSQSGGIKVPSLSVRAQMMNENQTQDLSSATWVREVYRTLDLTKGKNAALYYPEQPIGDKMNLYTMIFKLMGEGSLVAYNWNQGKDMFVEEQKVNFADVLKRLEIPFQQRDTYQYDEFSIPSNEALRYYIKEAWYFDQSNSVMGVKIVAICPVLLRQTYDDIDFGAIGVQGGAPEPQFWIPYENLRPYAARMPIMTSDLNNVMNKTIDDYFRMRMYDGEIYKTTNMEDKFLVEKYKTPEAQDSARVRIEGELRQFDKNLWVINDSIKALEMESRDNNKKKQKKTKVSKPQSSQANASFSARDRR